MQNWVDSTFDKIVDKFRVSTSKAKEQGLIPYRSEGKEWIGSPYEGNSWWTGGFWPGTMWLLHNATKEDCFFKEALRVEELLVHELMEFSSLNHDVGFMYLLSCGAHYRFTGDMKAHRNTMHAATILAGRFNPNGYIRAWDKDRAGWAIIDCMMNLSLLYWASVEENDPRFAQIARIHADTSMRTFVREDGSCNHIVIFDPSNGDVLDCPGGQGYAAGSSWSRGQAWALYGFALSYMHTGDKRYLETAERIANYFIANIRPDGLTDSDFCQPEDEERIDNIAGACAASGLLDLSGLTEDAALKQTFRDAAIKLLQGIDAHCVDWTEETLGIMQKCTASYHDDGAGRHINILYGDYFFVEAICKLRGADAKLWSPIKR